VSETTPGTALLVDDDADLRHALSQSLTLAGLSVESFAAAEAVLGRLGRDVEAVLVTDIRMPQMDGVELMRRALEIDPALPVVLITGHGDVPLAVEAMRAGAYDFIEKPFPTEDLVNVAKRALEKRRLVLENRVLRDELAARQGLEARLVGKSAAMERLRRTVAALAEVDADVLILGETGVGKEVVSRALHDEGGRRDKPFVAINCGALPAEIIESELFGHEAGAFTGANKQRIGKLEYAQGGTVLLDEIESMPLELQVKLLRVLETRSVERLGSNKAIPLDVRIVAASKEDLEEASDAGRFRRDLYFRLNVVSITIPPLRERKEDIPQLFYHLLREARARYRRDIPEVTPEKLAELAAQDWPGNVRELRNLADRFLLGLEEAEGPESPGQSPDSLAARLRDYERGLIEAELTRNGGSIKATYETFGLSRKGLYDKMKKLGVTAKKVGEDV
jgi:two-component system C4-dicarboxylate transport response regulator DctD